MKIRAYLTILASVLYIVFYGFYLGEIVEIYKVNPEYPYRIIHKKVEFAEFGAFSLTGKIEYEIPKSDTTLKPRMRQANCFLKGFYLGYTWDMPYAKGVFYKKKGKDILIVETHGKLEWRLLGIKIRSSMYSLGEDILIDNQ